MATNPTNVTVDPKIRQSHLDLDLTSTSISDPDLDLRVRDDLLPAVLLRRLRHVQIVLGLMLLQESEKVMAGRASNEHKDESNIFQARGDDKKG